MTPPPPDPSKHPWWAQKPQNTWFWSKFFKIFWGRTPRHPSYHVVTFMYVALLVLFLVLATTRHTFQAFRSLARQTPVLTSFIFQFTVPDWLTEHVSMDTIRRRIHFTFTTGTPGSEHVGQRDCVSSGNDQSRSNALFPQYFGLHFSVGSVTSTHCF